MKDYTRVAYDLFQDAQVATHDMDVIQNLAEALEEAYTEGFSTGTQAQAEIDALLAQEPSEDLGTWTGETFEPVEGLEAHYERVSEPTSDRPRFAVGDRVAPKGDGGTEYTVTGVRAEDGHLAFRGYEYLDDPWFDPAFFTQVFVDASASDGYDIDAEGDDRLTFTLQTPHGVDTYVATPWGFVLVR